jgi:hypothetical protein
VTTQLDDLYLGWLYDQTGLNKRGRYRTYYKLIRQMHSKEFVWVPQRDSSRAEDGKELRWEFVRSAGIPKVQAAWLYEPCTVLEMVVALARRLAFLTDGEARAWFSQLLFNLGATDYNDLNFDGYIQAIDEKLERLVWRTYQPNGEGGLFPLHYPASDQRSVEIWEQMNAWLLERGRKEG